MVLPSDIRRKTPVVCEVEKEIKESLAAIGVDVRSKSSGLGREV